MKSKIVVPVLGVALVALLGLTAKGCEALQGGPVRSAETFRDHVRATTRTGVDVYRALSPAPAKEPYASRQGSTSCVDDFGFDMTGVSRDEPIFTWGLDFASKDEYRAALASLRATWHDDGRTVEEVDNGIAATLDDGIRVTLHLGYYDGEPELRAQGTCMRYRHSYGDAYDYMHDDNGDGTVDEYERPN
ncbi:hypothetical protein PV664_36940 [Streptomyces sp. ME01-18a]|uniref:hypothetical protein n=1 Tax=Streptomyces sp. ME01-18a TaxID=3028669 RepID=UPI0029B41DCA|nr:hypothetical protein [Streptomyces sp. ME01-18a]MDX3434396.1 hypothetical protein [Streptomyces sp. ME01-18a]